MSACGISYPRVLIYPGSPRCSARNWFRRGQNGCDVIHPWLLAISSYVFLMILFYNGPLSSASTKASTRFISFSYSPAAFCNSGVVQKTRVNTRAAMNTASLLLVAISYPVITTQTGKTGKTATFCTYQ